MTTPKAPFWVALVGLIVMAVLTSIQDALTDQNISAQEWVIVVLQLVMAADVYLTANLPGYPHAKRYVAALIAGLTALVTFIVGGVSTPELINLGIVVLSALGVMVAPQPVTRTIDGQVKVYRASDGPSRMMSR